jgi:hypothetical protein
MPLNSPSYLGGDSVASTETRIFKSVSVFGRSAIKELAQLPLTKEVVERSELQAILKVVSIDPAKERKKFLEASGSDEAGASGE